MKNNYDCIFPKIQESLTLLKWSAAGFTMLQLLVLTVLTTLYLVAPGGWDVLGSSTTPEHRFLYIAIFILSFIATFNYLVLLFLYINKLGKAQSRPSPSSADHSKRRKNNKNRDTLRISHPIPQTSPIGSTSYSTTPTQRSTLLANNPESPGIYESLDHNNPQIALPLHQQQQQQQQIYYPGSSIYGGSKIYNNQHQQQIYADGIYGSGGGGSIISRGGTSSSMRSYPFPHQRYQQPLIRERQLLVEQAVEEDWPHNHNIANASSSSPSGMHYNKEQSRVVHLYGPSRPNSQQLQLQQLPVDHEPLLQQQQQPINWPSSHYQHHQHHHHHHQQQQHPT
jgi:hypothetical protein